MRDGRAPSPPCEKDQPHVGRDDAADRPLLLTTPNGWKASIMLEECGLPYRMIPINIARAPKARPSSGRRAARQDPVIVDPDGPGGDR